MAILNHRDYRLARARLRQLGRAVEPKAVIQSIKEGLSAPLADTRRQNIQLEIERLQTELSAYERLRDALERDEGSIEAEELGVLPILARISLNLSQRQLAELLGLKEQQIQRYERNRYKSISLEGYQRVLFTLGVEVHPRLSKSRSPVSAADQLEIDLTPDLLRDLRRRSWLELPRTMGPSELKSELSRYVAEAERHSGSGSLNRRSASRATNADGIIRLWRARVLRVAHESRGQLKGKFNVADTSWLEQLVRLSVFPDGPLRAASMLREHGIVLVVERHLDKTALDGAAFLLDDGIPVVAITLRHDRLDNFWFTLLHELAHIFLHFHHGLGDGFVDDMDESRVSEREQQADEFARNTFVPDEVWNSSVARFTRSPENVERFARAQSLHPAIVAGRIRRERDYKLFPSLVGSGQVRSLFLPRDERE